MDANIKITGISELSDKYFKVDSIKILEQAIMDKLKTNEKIESFGKDITSLTGREDIKKNQMAILELKVK